MDSLSKHLMVKKMKINIKLMILLTLRMKRILQLRKMNLSQMMILNKKNKIMNKLMNKLKNKLFKKKVNLYMYKVQVLNQCHLYFNHNLLQRII